MAEKRRKLLYVIHYPVFGGPHNQAAELNGSLRKRGYDTYVLIPDEEGNAFSRLVRNGVRVEKIPLSRIRATKDFSAQYHFIKSFVSDVNRLRTAIRRHKIDIVILCGIVNPHAAFAAKLEKKAVLWQVLDTRTPFLLRILLFPFIWSLSDIVMCTGQRVARMHPGLNRVKHRLVHFCPPVDTEKYKPDAKAWSSARAELNIPEDSILLGTVGNLNPQKGHERLIEVAAQLKRKYPDIFLRILGESTPTHVRYERILNELIESKNCHYKTQFQIVNPGDRISELLPAFDIFLLTSVSRSEGIPTVVLEAMACGLPVISTNVGSVQEIIEDGKTGYIVDSGRCDKIVEKVRMLIDDEALRKRMGKNARKSVVRNYNLQTCADIHKRAFDKALLNK